MVGYRYIFFSESQYLVLKNFNVFFTHVHFIPGTFDLNKVLESEYFFSWQRLLLADWTVLWYFVHLWCFSNHWTIVVSTKIHHPLLDIITFLTVSCFVELLVLLFTNIKCWFYLPINIFTWLFYKCLFTKQFLDMHCFWQF